MIVARLKKDVALMVHDVRKVDFNLETLIARGDGAQQRIFLARNRDLPARIVGKPTNLSVDPHANAMQEAAAHVVFLPDVRVINIAHERAVIERDAELPIRQDDGTGHRMMFIIHSPTC